MRYDLGDQYDIGNSPLLNRAENMRKIMRNSGKEYITKNSKVVSDKVSENKHYFCSKKCLNLLSSEDRRITFEHFWNLGDIQKV